MTLLKWLPFDRRKTKQSTGNELGARQRKLEQENNRMLYALKAIVESATTLDSCKRVALETLAVLEVPSEKCPGQRQTLSYLDLFLREKAGL